MNNEELEEVMVTNYAKVFKAILLSEFRTDPELKEDYYSSSMTEQRGIDSAIESRSSEMAESLVGKLKDKGYLAKSPSNEELERIIKEVIKDFGSDKK
ncbi:MAG TPA: hypothetical protein VGR56_02910 [Nitrososphaerales archaeon]|nr:hypothetical protein [Nitrososphaerales archaeon]